jgi:hypothetical protein
MTAEKVIELSDGNRREKPFAIEKIGEMKNENENENAFYPTPNKFQK